MLKLLLHDAFSKMLFLMIFQDTSGLDHSIANPF
jgi:hypothetical protein